MARLIGPMLNAQVDKLDLKGQSKTLRPMVERALNALLDSMKMRLGQGRRQGRRQGRASPAESKACS